MTQSIAILMPSGALSIPKTHRPILSTRRNAVGASYQIVDNGSEFNADTILLHAAAYAKEMRRWTDFEAWIILYEDGLETSRQHIKT